MKMEKTKIKFRDLSGWLKFAVIISFVTAGLYAISFIQGFIIGFLSA